MAEKPPYRHHIPLGEHEVDGITSSLVITPELLQQIRDFPYDDNDIVIATYPKSGTTWVQKLVEFLRYPGEPEDIKSFEVQKYMACMEHGTNHNDPLKPVLEMTPPRYLKTHLYGHNYEKALTGGKVKFIVVVRNVKDVLVSFYHWYTYAAILGPFTGTWTEFFDDLVHSDHLICGNWFNHVKSWIKYKDNDNVLLIRYEDLLQNLGDELKRLASFLNIEASDDKIKKIEKYSTFDMLKKNIDQNLEFELLGPYLRKGKAGGWKEFFTDEQNKFIDEKYKIFTEETGFSVDFEI